MSRALSLFVALLALGASAGELSGVKVPDTVQVDGKELKLNGMGLRQKFVFKVYVTSLYLEHPSKDAAAVLASDEVRKIELKMLRDLDRKTIVEAFNVNFEDNAGAKFPALKERLEKFTAVIPDVKEGQNLNIIYVPGKGTRVDGAGAASYTAEGKDFADALFSVWLGASPVEERLKQGLLGLGH